MGTQTHLIPTYPSVDDVIQELSTLGLKAFPALEFDPVDGEPIGDALSLSHDAARQIIVWCQTEWDRRQREGGA